MNQTEAAELVAIGIAAMTKKERANLRFHARNKSPMLCGRGSGCDEAYWRDGKG